MNPYLDEDLVALGDHARRFATDRIVAERLVPAENTVEELDEVPAEHASRT